MLLISTIAINAGYQCSATFLGDPFAIDVCEQTDGETECEKEGKDKADDVISHELKSIAFIEPDLNITGSTFEFDYSLNHPEIFTPPPQYLI
ncbi:MAG: hypothetical protein DHS20C17_10760 [Cyclobacteriaceae bacterium]|nr:MAG: hypothetical protein DHS20C17_10760 [Cyclobacteriaceae bacterium]